ICVEPSLTISNRQVAGVRRALTRASPLREWGLGLPRLTSRNSAGLVRNFLALLVVSIGLSARNGLCSYKKVRKRSFPTSPHGRLRREGMQIKTPFLQRKSKSRGRHAAPRDEGSSRG